MLLEEAGRVGGGRLFDDLIRPSQHQLRDREAQSFCGFEIDDQLELRWLLDGEIGGLGTLENLIDEDGDSAELFRLVHPVRHEQPDVDVRLSAADVRQVMFQGQIG